MPPTELHPPDWLECGAAHRPLPGESESGDRALVAAFADGALVAVVDGLGHGPDAAAAARLAVEALGEAVGDLPAALVERCHERLRSTRGVVMSLASFRPRESALVWLGIGDVEGMLFRADPRDHPPRECLLMRGGVVGYQLPTLHEARLSLEPGDLLVFATDGVRAQFTEGVDLGGPAQQVADEILARHGKGTDDALVVAARYRGPTE